MRDNDRLTDLGRCLSRCFRLLRACCPGLESRARSQEEDIGLSRKAEE